MQKIQQEHAYLVQAMYQAAGDCNLLYKALWIGAKESVRALNAKIAGVSDLVLEDGTEFTIQHYKEKRFLFQRLDANYFIGGIIVKDDMQNVVAGTKKQELLDQAFQILTRNCPYPLLREWMPGIWQSCLESETIFPIETFGLDMKAYYVCLPETSAIEQMLMSNIAELRQQAIRLLN